MKYLVLVLLGSSCLYLDAARQRLRAMVRPVPEAKILPGSIKRISAQDLRAAVEFWSDRMKEHTIYLQNALDSARLKNIGKKLQQKLENFRAQLPASGPIDKSLLNSYKRTLRQLKAYKHVARFYARRHKMKALPALIKHMLEELNYHLGNISGVSRTPAEEKAFWARHDKEVVELNKLKPSLSSKEAAILKKLMELGLKEHESLEDAYGAVKQETRSAQ